MVWVPLLPIPRPAHLPPHVIAVVNFVRSYEVIKNIFLGNVDNYKKYLALFCMYLKIHKWYSFIWQLVI